jgi:hypothetical protein
VNRARLAALSLVIAAGTVVGAHDVAEARAPLCHDSNGSAPGGSVYLDYYTTVFVCDVVPPQRLHITRTPSLRACNEMSGHGWTSTYRICWDVDY